MTAINEIKESKSPALNIIAFVRFISHINLPFMDNYLYRFSATHVWLSGAGSDFRKRALSARPPWWGRRRYRRVEGEGKELFV